MTELLEKAIEAARQLSPEEQDELAQLILEIVQGADDEVDVLSEEEEAAIDEGLAELERGEFVNEEELAAILTKYHR
jgi:predicted transcriptional regulator